MTETRERRKVRNPGIADRGRDAALKARTASDAEIERAKREIEEEVARPGAYVLRTVTMKAVVKKAGLSAAFLEKPSRAETKRELVRWLVGVNEGLAEGGRHASSGVKRNDQARGDLAKLQNAFVEAELEYIDRGHQLRKSLERIKELELENRRLRESSTGSRLAGAGRVGWKAAMPQT